VKLSVSTKPCAGVYRTWPLWRAVTPDLATLTLVGSMGLPLAAVSFARSAMDTGVFTGVVALSGFATGGVVTGAAKVVWVVRLIAMATKNAVSVRRDTVNTPFGCSICTGSAAITRGAGGTEVFGP
jgi:hypothetical protein